MPHYRLYFLDAKGHLNDGLDLDCRDDNEAIAHAKTHEVGYGIDLWHGPRRVTVLRAPAGGDPFAS